MTLTTADLVGRAHTGGMDEIDPSALPLRRTFTADEKHAYLDAYDAPVIASPNGSPDRGRRTRQAVRPAAANCACSQPRPASAPTRPA